MSAQILTVSSKGQISLPVSIRKLLSIDTGDKLVAYTSGDVIMRKGLLREILSRIKRVIAAFRKAAISIKFSSYGLYSSSISNIFF